MNVNESLGTYIKIEAFESEEIELKSFETTVREFLIKNSFGEKKSAKNLDAQQIITRCFEILPLHRLEDLASDILSKNSAFTLSTTNQLYKIILEDKWPHQLNNDSFSKLLREHEIDSEEQIASYYDFALRIDHLGIYSPAATAVSPQEYSINVLWVNLNPQDRISNIANNIFGEGLNVFDNEIVDPLLVEAYEKAVEQKQEALRQKIDTFNKEFELLPEELRPAFIEERGALVESERYGLDEELKKLKNLKSFTYRISQWADGHPRAQINVWYDSALVTEKARLKSKEAMKSISNLKGVDLRLRDVRLLPNVPKRIEDSLHPATPIYYRVDILKALIADYLISSPLEAARYAVVLDIDVELLPVEQLFDARTLEHLDNSGYVFGVKPTKAEFFENSFFIFDKEKKGLQAIHREALIERNYPIAGHPKFMPIDERLRNENLIDRKTLFTEYPKFTRAMVDLAPRHLGTPSKLIRFPTSQFFLGGDFSQCDHQEEAFYFYRDKVISYLEKGRHYKRDSNTEEQIEQLRSFKVEPLQPE